MKKTNGFCVMAVLVVGLFETANAQQPDSAQIKKVESQLQQLTNEVGNLKTNVDRVQADFRKHADSGAALFLFGVVCALWAQNSGRNPWLWFFLGLFFSVITGLVMLYKNSQDRNTPR